MEIYTLDIALRRSAIIEDYYSFIWTERFNSMGDFKLRVPSIPKFRSILAPGQVLAHSDSKRLMFIETLEDVITSEGKKETIASGRSYEKILDDRILAHPTEPKWEYTAPPADVARQMFDDIIVDFLLTPGDDADTIDWYAQGNSYPGDNIIEPEDPITYSTPPTSLYKAIQEVCVEHRLGFRITRNGEESEIFFNVFPGNDRTPKGPDPYPIIFSEGLNNLQNISSLATNAVEKSVVWVISQFGDREIVISDNGDGIGVSRKQIVIDAENITEEMTPEERSTEMQRQGRQMLSVCRPITAFDGEIDRNFKWRYDQDYYLGDLVGVAGDKGQINYMRVTEQIFVSDAEGYRTYPTLSVDTAADPGTWLAWGGQKEWDDLTTEVWSDIGIDDGGSGGRD